MEKKKPIFKDVVSFELYGAVQDFVNGTLAIVTLWSLL